MVVRVASVYLIQAISVSSVLAWPQPESRAPFLNGFKYISMLLQELGVFPGPCYFLVVGGSSPPLLGASVLLCAPISEPDTNHETIG